MLPVGQLDQRGPQMRVLSLEGTRLDGPSCCETRIPHHGGRDVALSQPGMSR